MKITYKKRTYNNINDIIKNMKIKFLKRNIEHNELVYVIKISLHLIENELVNLFLFLNKNDFETLKNKTRYLQQKEKLQIISKELKISYEDFFIEQLVEKNIIKKRNN